MRAQLLLLKIHQIPLEQSGLHLLCSSFLVKNSEQRHLKQAHLSKMLHKTLLQRQTRDITAFIQLYDIFLSSLTISKS